MSLFRRLFERRDPPAKVEPPSPPEHAVLVHLNLRDDQFGVEAEREAIHAMSDRMDDAIEAANAGEFDGDEFGAGECTLFMYGPDADALFAAVEPILRADEIARGAKVVKRFGEASDPNARIETVQL